MITLKVCFGMFLGLCGSMQHFSFETMEECQIARQEMLERPTIGDGYAMCLKELTNTHERNDNTTNEKE